MTRLLTTALLILVSSACFAAEDEPFDLQLLSVKGRGLYTQLVRTGSFGFDTTKSAPLEGDKALHLLLKEEFAVEALMRLVTEADLAGQLYALSALHAKDANLFSEALKICQQRTQGVRSRVVVRSAGASSDVDIRGIIKDIQAGRYDTDVTSRSDSEFLTDEGRVFYNQLRRAESFDVLETTTPSQTSKNQRALQALMKEEGPVNVLNHLLDSANAAGKMLALCGLHALDEGSFDKAVRKLKDQKDKVMVISERSAKETEIPELIETIDSGRYDAFVR